MSPQIAGMDADLHIACDVTPASGSRCPHDSKWALLVECTACATRSEIFTCLAHYALVKAGQIGGDRCYAPWAAIRKIGL